MFRKIRRSLERLLSSSYLTISLMFYSVFLIFIATIAQLEVGVAESASIYFESFFAMAKIGDFTFPIISGATIGILAVVNIFFSSMKYMSFGVSGFGNSIIHSALALLIISGALQFFMRQEARVSLCEGESSDVMFVEKDGVSKTQKFPFSIRLLKFTKENWKGSDIPKSFSSKVVFVRGNSNTEALIEMNSPVSFDGWTFYQTSYAEDGKVSILTAVKNPARMLPWLAVFATIFGMILTILAKLKKK